MNCSKDGRCLVARRNPPLKPLTKGEAEKTVKRVSDSHVSGFTGMYVKYFSERFPREVLKKLLMNEEENGGPKSAVYMGATSQKAIKSSIKLWFNSVIYLSPADRAALSFCLFYPRYVDPLVAALEKAAAENPAWRRFAVINKALLKKYVAEIDRYAGLADTGSIDSSMQLPALVAHVGPLTSCPFASTKCRSLCLNTSGRGWPTEKKAVSVLGLEKFAGIRRETIQSALDYILVTSGRQGYYGGQNSTIQASRVRRTHQMWLVWATQGVLQNDLYDMWVHEVKNLKCNASTVGMELAIRLNGTSDYPFHTVRTSDGRNMMARMGYEGAVCYDYTKDSRRMKRWIASRSWIGAPAIVAGKSPKTFKGEFPPNYYLTFSWSEENYAVSLDILRAGGNVTMVFMRSTQAGKDKHLFPASSSGAKMKDKERLQYPEEIAVARISPFPRDRDWIATVINGDETDLRFLDPYNVAKPYVQGGVSGGGVVVGLVNKGVTKLAVEDYTAKVKEEVWKRFVQTVRIETVGGKRRAAVRMNPSLKALITKLGKTRGAEEGAVHGADKDLARENATKVGDWYVLPTGLGV